MTEKAISSHNKYLFFSIISFLVNALNRFFSINHIDKHYIVKLLNENLTNNS